MTNRKGKLILYVALTFLISWGMWLPAVLLGETPLTSGLSQAGIFGPLLAVVVMFPMYNAKKMFRKLFDRNFPKKYLMYSFLLGVGLPAFVYLVIVYREGLQFELGSPIQSIPLLAMIILFVEGPIEEFGWRGFFLTRVLKETNLVFASLIVGLIHGIWYWPLHFMADTVQSHMPIYQFVLLTALSGFVYTWLYANTQGSLLMAIFYHWMANLGNALFIYWTSESGRLLYFVLLMVFVLTIFIRDYKKLRLKIEAINVFIMN